VSFPYFRGTLCRDDITKFVSDDCTSGLIVNLDAEKLLRGYGIVEGTVMRRPGIPQYFSGPVQRAVATIYTVRGRNVGDLFAVEAELRGRDEETGVLAQQVWEHHLRKYNEMPAYVAVFRLREELQDFIAVIAANVPIIGAKPPHLEDDMEKYGTTDSERTKTSAEKTGAPKKQEGITPERQKEGLDEAAKGAPKEESK
jgi:hypothetical protein